MTKEELKKEAEEYAKNLAFVFETDIVQRIVRERVRLALIDVLEPREMRIEELEKELKDKDSQLNNWYKEWQKQNERIADLEQKLEQTEKDLADYQFNYPTINELEEANNELKGKLLLSDMVLADKTKRIEGLENKLTEKVTLESLDVVSARMEELAKVNADLKEQINAKDILIKELQEQKVYWKESSFDWRHKFFKKGSTKRLVQKSKQLAKAKELLAKWVELFKPKGGNIPPTPIQVATEQFLSEVEK